MFFGFKGGAFYGELIMGFNFSHPQKSGGAMAPLAPPSERALFMKDIKITNVFFVANHFHKKETFNTY